jgi:diguanylate cyclase (GGDEF)-like protein
LKGERRSAVGKPQGKSVMRSDSASEVLDAVIRQDKLRLCELHDRLLRRPEVDLWAFFRWDRSERRFKLMYPALTPSVPFPSDLHSLLEKRTAFADNNIPGSYGEWVETKRFPATLICPLFYNTELVGLLQGFSTQPVEICQRALKVVNSRFHVLAQSWHLVGLLEEKERIACTDSLTGLFNSKFLLHFLKAELARCARYKKSVAVLFMDIDFFKNVNDAYGHLVGSAVLHEVGRLIRHNVRDADTVARYGGDEYVVVLTEIGEEEAINIAERLRRTVEDHRFCQRKSLAVALTVSIGVAAFPQHGRSADEMIHFADTAMYEAKRDNRNCVRVAH